MGLIARLRNRTKHWESVYTKKRPTELGWYRKELELSLELIRRLAPDRTARIIDVGAGASTLVDSLLAEGYSAVTLLDVSEAALETTRKRLGDVADGSASGPGSQSAAAHPAPPDSTPGAGAHPHSANAGRVEYVVADLTEWAPQEEYDLWHDRAVLHFMTGHADRAAYLEAMDRALAPDGTAIIATFAPNGPRSCAGLPVVRFDAEGLQQELGSRFRIQETHGESHSTPVGTVQPFNYFVVGRS
jgi:SAM-dependent methyltransferase